MKKILILIFILTHNYITAQYQITIDVCVKDKQTSQAIPFAKLNFKEKEIKTISDAKGNLLLTYDENAVIPTDTLELSAVGYKTRKTVAKQFYRYLKNTNVIYLHPKNSNKKNVIDKRNISGRITLNTIPIQGASVKIKNSLYERLTDNEGYYSVTAKPSDVLVVEYLGTKKKEVYVGTKKKIDIQLEPDGELIDEVVVDGKLQKEEKIEIGLGNKRNSNSIGYSVNTFTEKDIKSHHINLNDVIGGKYAGIPVVSVKPGETPIYKLRGFSINMKMNAIYDVDGQIYNTNAEPAPQVPIIDVQNIKSITVLKSLASTNKYGTLGRGGVIVIRTKTLNNIKAKAKKRKSALVKGNDYTENISLIADAVTTPLYLQKLQKSNSFKEAKKRYEDLKLTEGYLNIGFYLDAATYFTKWDKNYVSSIFSSVEELAKENVKALKSIAYTYESLGMLPQARSLYERILLLRPKDAQSYRDLALIYANTGHYDDAMRLYRQMLNGIDGVEFSGINQPIIDELEHFLTVHRSKVDFSNLPSKVLSANFKQDIRVVFEWNDPRAEFELQFVNPDKKFYIWSHTLFNNKKRLLDEIKKGYTTEVSIVDEIKKGEWLINLESLTENPSTNPNYLKYTIYKNYGLPNETKKVKVVSLQNINQKVTLDRFVN